MKEEQRPDRWVILNIKYKDATPTKVILSAWGGSYLYGGSWRRSSSIESIVEQEDAFIVTTHTGTVYTLDKQCQGMNSISSNIYQSIVDNAKEYDTEVSIEEL